MSPPVPLYCSAIASFVSQPSLLGTENFWSSASEAGPAAIIPAIVSSDPGDDDDPLVGEDPAGE